MGMFDNDTPKFASPGSAIDANIAKIYEMGYSGAKKLGQGITGSMGFGSKEGAVMDIMKNIDYKNSESMMEGFKGIMSIDPSAGKEFRTQIMPMIKELQEFEAKDLSLNVTKNTPVLKTEWRLDVGKKWTKSWANMYLPGQPQGITTLSELNKYLSDLVKSGSMKNTEKNGWLNTYKAEEKAKREAYITTNAPRSGKKSSNLIPSKDVFNSGNQGTKVKLGTSQYKYNQLLKEFNSLQGVADQAFNANPGAGSTIYEELRKRQDALREQMLALSPKIKVEANAPFSKDAVSIFDANAAKYNK